MGKVNLIDKVKNAVRKSVAKIDDDTPLNFDFRTKEQREKTASKLRDYALADRAGREAYWAEMKRYYDGEHCNSENIEQFFNENGIDWRPSESTDGFISVETQIDSSVPDFEFFPRDGLLDPEKAKQREDMVRFILQNNKLNKMNIVNERRLNLFGNAVFKVCWNETIKGPGYEGDVEIGNPHIKNILFDPTAKCLGDCEFIIMESYIHRNKAWRMFKDIFMKEGLHSPDDLKGDFDYSLMENNEKGLNQNQVEIVKYSECWFRQPTDGSESYTIGSSTKKVAWEAGDIACVCLIGSIEVKYIPKYWIETGFFNKRYPFVLYGKIPETNSIYSKSELEMVRGHIDNIDRSLSMTQLNEAMMANDIIVVEDETLNESSELSNAPGAVWKTKSGRSSGVRRLGGLQNNGGLKESVAIAKNMIENTTGAYESYSGAEPQKVTTATGLAIMNDRARSRLEVKNADRLDGYKDLYELIDWTALEFINDNRVVYLYDGAAKKGKQFSFNANDYKIISNDEFYLPMVDAHIHIGDGLKKSKAFTISATQELLTIQITPQNAPFIKEYVELLDLPNKARMLQNIDKVLESIQPPPAGAGGEPQMPTGELDANTLADMMEKENLSEEDMAEIEGNPQEFEEILRGKMQEN